MVSYERQTSTGRWMNSSAALHIGAKGSCIGIKMSLGHSLDRTYACTSVGCAYGRIDAFEDANLGIPAGDGSD